MRRNRADTLVEQYGKFSPMSVNEAAAMASKVFSSSPASREEAESLLLAGALFDATDQSWRHITVQEVRRHLLDGTPSGQMQNGGEDWLIATLATTQIAQWATLELVQAIMQGASNATERLGRLGLRAALECLKAAVPVIGSLESKTA